MKYSSLACYCSFVTSIRCLLSRNVIITDIQMLQFVQQQIIFHMGGELQYEQECIPVVCVPPAH